MNEKEESYYYNYSISTTQTNLTIHTKKNERNTLKNSEGKIIYLSLLLWPMHWISQRFLPST